MRLDDFDPNLDIQDQGRGGGGFGGFGGGGGGGGLLFGLLPLIGSRFGCGGIVVVLLLMAVFGGLGNLGGMLGGGGGGTGTSVTRSEPAGGGGGAAEACSTDPARRAACQAFSSADKTWEALFARQGQQFRAPGLRFFTDSGQSGCGAAQSAMGPFYCPTDSRIYIDTSFSTSWSPASARQATSRNTTSSRTSSATTSRT